MTLIMYLINIGSIVFEKCFQRQSYFMFNLYCIVFHLLAHDYIRVPERRTRDRKIKRRGMGICKTHYRKIYYLRVFKMSQLNETIR